MAAKTSKASMPQPADEPANGTVSGQFRKGFSGNPSGRPKSKPFRDALEAVLKRGAAHSAMSSATPASDLCQPRDERDQGLPSCIARYAARSFRDALEAVLKEAGSEQDLLAIARALCGQALLGNVQGIREVARPMNGTKAYRAASQGTRRGPFCHSSGATEIAPDHPDPCMAQALLMEALSTTDACFVVGLIGQLADTGTRRRKLDERELNFMLSVVKGAKPKDQIEAMLAAQMAAVHTATMTFARRLANVENIAQQDSAERAFNKLARTFASQVEALIGDDQA
jgi:hypothetical protein